MRRIDGDRAPRGFLLHARLHRQTRAQRQIVQRNDRRIRDDADLQPRVVQNPRRREALFPQLLLGFRAERRADQHRLARLDQMPDDQVAFRHMVQRDVHVKFLRDADRRQDVVRAVGMRLERNLLAENRQQRFQLHVERARLGRVLLGLLDLLRVALRLEERLAQRRRDGHARNRHLVAVLAVNALGVLAERNLHRRRVFENHVVHAVAVQLHRHKRAAQHVRRAGAGHRRRHAAANRVAECFVPRVDAVDGANFRRNRAGILVRVVALPAARLLVHADVAVRIDKARRDDAARRVDDLRPCRNGEVLPHRGDLAAVDENLSVFDVAARDRLDQAALNQFHVYISFSFMVQIECPPPRYPRPCRCAYPGRRRPRRT